MFIDENSDIDREALRTFVLSELKNYKTQAQHLIKDQPFATKWNKVKDTIASNSEYKDEVYQPIIEQILQLPKYIDSWIRKSVDTPERLEFFIGSKAEEISSGDESKDYFWAMQIRHDQLIALTRVLGRLLNEIESWVKEDATSILEEPILQGLLDYDIEEQIYLEAENIHKQRQSNIK